jgi:hypothetical protein
MRNVRIAVLAAILAICGMFACDSDKEGSNVRHRVWQDVPPPSPAP